MDETELAATVYFTALRRAAHQILDRPPIFADPLAVEILGREGRSMLDEHIAANIEEPAAAKYKTTRTMVAARSRYVEDALAAAVARGIRQYVILGAGLDTFAYRNTFADAALRVFEVDLQTTQALKQARLAEAEIPLPDMVRFVPLNLKKPLLVEALDRAGFDFGKPAFFSCLSVIRHLTRKTVLRTFAEIARSVTAGSEIVFDFAQSPLLRRQLILWIRAARRRPSNNPASCHFHTSALVRKLSRLGFHDFEILGPQEINDRYCATRQDGLACSSDYGGRLIKACL
jgi:methyltransferase (TIGR00027 family)